MPRPGDTGDEVRSSMSSGTPGKRRGNLPKESKEKLKQWLSMHVEHSYPTEEEKKDLATEAGMTMGQALQFHYDANHVLGYRSTIGS
jgi:hypothetical protein